MADETAVLKRFLKAQDRLVIQASDLSLESLSKMVASKAINVTPSFQRRDRWPLEKASALIESFLLNIPIPPVYLAEDEFGKYSVVDGKQRLTAIHRFMTNGLRLAGLEKFKEIEGKNFEALPTDLKNALSVRPYLRVITLLKQSDPELKYEVFERLNRGGEAMEAQEIRNVAFMGPLNTAIYKMAEAPFLRERLKIKTQKEPAFSKMVDAEMVVRFLALRWVSEKYLGDLRQVMDRFMETHRKSSSAKILEFRATFLGALDACEEIWGDHAFQRPAGTGWRDQFLNGMYDAQMLSVANLRPREVAAARRSQAEIVKKTRQAFNSDKEFESAVREATNTPSRLTYRIDKIAEILRSV